eukprot:1152708-Pelagomonas_calceolata.AAC.1
MSLIATLCPATAAKPISLQRQNAKGNFSPATSCLKDTERVSHAALLESRSVSESQFVRVRVSESQSVSGRPA